MGFPFVVALDAEGMVIAKHPPQLPTMDSLWQVQSDADKLMGLRANAAGDEVPPKIELFMAELDLGMGFEEGRARLAELKSHEIFAQMVTDAQAAEIEQKLIRAELNDIMINIPAGLDQEQAIRHAGARVLAMHEAGRTVTNGASQEGGMYWNILLAYAAMEQDIEQVDAVAAEWKKRIVGDPRADQLGAWIDARVQEAKNK